MSAENIKHNPSDQALEPKQLETSLKSASPVLVKILEMVLSALCLSLILVPFDNKLSISIHRSGVVCVGFSLPIIVNFVNLVGHFRRLPTPKETVCLFSAICAILLFTASGILISDWFTFMRSIHFLKPKMFMDLMMSAAVFSFLLGIICIIDIYLTYKYY